MRKCYRELAPAEKLITIHSMTDDIYLSKRECERIVGGRKRLEDLIYEGKIRGRKKSGAQNSRWTINLSDVLKYVQPLF